MGKPKARSALWIGMTLLLALAIHFGFIVLYPQAIIAGLQRRLVKDVGKNHLRHGARPSDKDRIVVGPCPDLIYSIGVFDVSETPLRITAPLPGSYMSLSLYADNSDNFFVQNDRQLESSKFDLVVIGPHAPELHLTGVTTVRAPSKTGIILFRYFAGEGIQFEKIDALRHQIVCDPLPSVAAQDLRHADVKNSE
jgi:uncharacterized membrane protein